MAFTYARKSNPGVIPALQVIPAKAAVRRLGITFLSKCHSGQAVKAQGESCQRKAQDWQRRPERPPQRDEAGNELLLYFSRSVGRIAQGRTLIQVFSVFFDVFSDRLQGAGTLAFNR